MIIKKFLIFFIFFLHGPLLCELPLIEQFKQLGYLEICNANHEAATFDSLYGLFDQLIEFFQTNPVWAQKLYSVKERFIRSKDRNYYSTDFFGLYDESKTKGRGQISFYYSIHFHQFIVSHYPELKDIPEITGFLDACFQIQEPYGNLFDKTALQLGLETIFSCSYGRPPILLKVVKYLPSYIATKPHYDGTAFSLFLDSTANQSLLLSSYKSSFTIADFFSPLRKYSREDNQYSILLIPGTHLSEFSIYPTPHIVVQTGKVRYATIAFAMRPYHASQRNEYSLLPNFKD